MNLEQVSVLKTRISQIKKVKKGAHIGYGTDGLTKRDVTIAIVPIGYADGYGRVFGKVGGLWVYTITMYQLSGTYAWI